METIKINSRYGKSHQLVPTESENIYMFVTAESWMPISLHKVNDKYIAIDPDGGPMIGIGGVIGGKTIKSIQETDEGILIELC